MRNSILHAAIVAAIAGTASMTAGAVNTYNINMSGASAQRTLWENDIEAITGGSAGVNADANGNPVCTIIKTSAALSFPGGTSGSAVPDLHAALCTVSASRITGAPTLPSGIAAGDIINMYYEAEFGSVWGIAPAIPGSPANTKGRLELVGNAACSASSNLVPYFRDTDTSTSTCYQGPFLVDVEVSDLDPVFWSSTDNYSYSDGLVYPAAINGTGPGGVMNILQAGGGAAQPTLAQLQALENGGGYSYVNGEVFTFITDKSAAGTTAGPSAAITNLSTQSLRSIFTGAYKTWSQVPEALGLANNSASIVVCRRDHGSGSETTLSWFLTGHECGGNNGTGPGGGATGTPPRIASLADSPQGAAIGSLDQTVGTVDGIGPQNPIENFSTNDVKSCLTAAPGVSIGWITLAPSSAYNTLSIDGVPANAHNGAFGIYRAVAEDWALNNVAVAHKGDPLLANYTALVGALISDVSKNTGSLAKEGGGMVAGQWQVGANTPQTNFYLQDKINAAPSISAAANSGNPSTPTAVWTNGGVSACTILKNNNKL